MRHRWTWIAALWLLACAPRIDVEVRAEGRFGSIRILAGVGIPPFAARRSGRGAAGRRLSTRGEEA
jgi:hypothetical protein